MSSHPAPLPIILWAPPRSCSTAFERAVINHPSTTVLHEAFADPCYFGPERLVKRDRSSTDDIKDAALESSGLNRDSTYESTWEKWDGWHDDAAKSSGFKAPVHGDEADELPKEVTDAIAGCMPLYEELYAQRLGLEAAA
ncbi:hypothetical protein TeGR_g12098 [Tetraparma gracilis]|uniref:Sulfotransferase n=1 Tax=Tetraparma gracilis TaxID=2962635 RepID=A0ABQ6MLI6_9STRA|nr:hypothetical protein TeGR_g12098 [Tetraparma gracilis]